MKTGLVLEGGALRAIFSSGVCDALLDGNVMADYVIGVSAGIAYGVSYVSKQSRRNLEVVTRFVRDPRYMGMSNLLNKENRSYFGLDFAYNVIPNQIIPFDYDTFQAFPGEVEAVVTNLNTGKAEYFPVPRYDRSPTLLRATCAMPLMFPIFELEGQPYLDGGVSDGIPWKHALEQGCDRLIVVLTRTRSYRRKGERVLSLIRKKYEAYPNFVALMERRAEIYNQSRQELFELERQGKALVIAPDSTLGVSRTERNPEKLRMLWAAGYQTMVERMDELRAYLDS